MELDKVIALIRAVSDSELTGLILEEGNLHLELQKVPVLKGQEMVLQTAAKEGWEALKEPQNVTVEEKAEKPEKRESLEEGKAVCSPLVGTFYCAPSEGEKPFVKVGDSVKKGQVLGIIEAMKLMNEIEAEQDGIISAVLVENGQLVEYGQKLFLMQ